MPVVVVLRRENASVGRGLAVEIFCFFDDHAEGVAVPRVGVEVQVVAGNLRQAVGQLWRFAGIGDGVEQGIANLPADRFGLRARKEFS